MVLTYVDAFVSFCQSNTFHLMKFCVCCKCKWRSATAEGGKKSRLKVPLISIGCTNVHLHWSDMLETHNVGVEARWTICSAFQMDQCSSDWHSLSISIAIEIKGYTTCVEIVLCVQVCVCVVRMRKCDVCTIFGAGHEIPSCTVKT